MRKVFALGMCLCLATLAWAGTTDQVIDDTHPVYRDMVPPTGGPGVSAPQVWTGRVSCFSDTLDYTAAVVDNDGAGNLFIKLQSQSPDGNLFDACGFYNANNASGWPGQTGGAAFFVLTLKFSAADVKVEHDGAGNVTLTISNTVPPGMDQVHVRGGWTPRNGSLYGYGGYSANGTQLDDFGVGGNVCDDFNRADGPLGPDWTEVAGTGSIVSQQARGANLSLANFTGVCGGGDNCVYTLSKSKSKGGCGNCPARGSDYRTETVCAGPEDCSKKLKTSISCPDGEGTCKLKGKGPRCE